jgi:7-carboxy-7-deazaguanine synthase
VTYSVKEIFYTLQGEGANAGRPAVFCRFAGCNLWSGREEDRATAVCQFCDTDFVGTDGTAGGKYATASALAETIGAHWCGGTDGTRFAVLTGGEPLLQVDEALVGALHDLGFEIAVETNGTVQPPPGIDWLCVSPKAGADLRVLAGDELKVVVPQPSLDLDRLAETDFSFHWLQPMDGPLKRENTQWAINRCLNDPRWRLSVQSHKVIGIR